MDDLKLIKRHYGEKMMHLCRELFPTLLETPGLLFGLMSKKFAYSRTLYDDIVVFHLEDSFKAFIYSLVDKKVEKKEATKTPTELLDEAGYILYECHSEEDIQKFKKYYAPNEELCTFRGGRLDRCYVFFAVKKDVDEIERKNFPHPERQDKYGTSVISIQFSRGDTNTVSIKNRYNHTVAHPDATFNNNLDNIIPGLTESFEQEYGLNTAENKTDFYIPGYVVANDGKFYKYNLEVENIYFCPDNIMIDNFEVGSFDKSRFLLFDHYMIDFKNKRISTKVYPDTFTRSIGTIEKITVINDSETKNKLIIINDDIKLVINNQNQLIEYENPHITEVDEDYLTLCYYIRKVSLPNAKIIHSGFLDSALDVQTLDLPNVEYIEGQFLPNCRRVDEFNLQNLKKIGDGFMEGVIISKDLYLPNVEEVGEYFMPNSQKIGAVNIPKLKVVGRRFLCRTKEVGEINLPSLEIISDNFMEYCTTLKSLSLPSVKSIGSSFLEKNDELESLDLPNVEIIDSNFLSMNSCLEHIELPKIKRIGSLFLANNQKIKTVSLPEVKSIGKLFLNGNQELDVINLPKIENIGDGFLENNNKLISVLLPNVTMIGNNFLTQNDKIETIDLPNVTRIGSNFLAQNNKIEIIDLPNVKTIKSMFLKEDTKIKSINLPNVEAVGEYFLLNAKELESVNFPRLERVGESFMSYCINLKSVELASLTSAEKYFLRDAIRLETIIAPNLYKLKGLSIFNYENQLKNCVTPYRNSDGTANYTGYQI